MAKQEIKLSDGKSSRMNPGEIRSVNRSWRGRYAHTGNDEPSDRHRRNNKHEQPSNMFLHIRSRQLDPDREQANG